MAISKLNDTHTICASCLRYITQAIINNFAPLLFLIFRDSFGVPLEKITLLITINFLMQLLIDSLATKFADKLGYRPCIIAAHLLASLGIIGLAVPQGFCPMPLSACCFLLFYMP